MSTTAADSFFTKQKRKRTVKLNVGGTHYEVSQSLLDQFPDSMLFTSSCDRWTTGQGEDEAIFIDRNGQRFQYVLDYMRDSRVELPFHIPKGLFLTDLEYLGVNVTDESRITLSVANPKDLFSSLNSYRSFFQKKEAAIDEKSYRLACERLAYSAAKEFISSLAKSPDPRQQVTLPNYFEKLRVQIPITTGHGKSFRLPDIQVHLNTYGLVGSDLTSDRYNNVTIYLSLQSSNPLNTAWVGPTVRRSSKSLCSKASKV